MKMKRSYRGRAHQLVMDDATVAAEDRAKAKLRSKICMH